jgi:hypothetical protein
VYGDYGGEEKCNQYSLYKKNTSRKRQRDKKKEMFARKHELSTSTQASYLQDRQKIRKVDSDAV